jgi:hypothetical protein
MNKLMMRIVCGAAGAIGGLLVPTAAFGWGATIHKSLAGKYYDETLIANFATEFGTSVSTVVNGAGELDSASSSVKAIYHSGQWTMMENRYYVYRPGASDGNVWYGLDETTRLKYMMHNLGDVAVPIGHSPANTVPGAEPNQMKEALLEGFADLGSYGSPSVPTSWYAGTISQIVSTFRADCVANAQNYVASSDNTTAAHEGWRISQMLGKAVLADYYLSQRSAADAGPNKTVRPGGIAVFDAMALRDPDNITWNTDGTYYYRSDWTGISRVRWDFDGNGVYDATGVQIAKNYNQLWTALGGNTSATFGIEVLDDEGRSWYDTASLTLTAPLPGDGNLDGTVNFTDLNTLLTNYNQSGSWSRVAAWTKGDFDGNNVVNFSDLNALLTHYNQTAGGPTVDELLAAHGITMVPEPSAIAMVLGLLMTAVVWCGLRR